MAETPAIQSNNQVVIPKQQEKPLEANKEIAENQPEIKQDEVVLAKSNEVAKIDKSSKDPINLVWGLLKGVVKEAFSILTFFGNFILHPVDSIKGFCSGVAGLFKLISNPTLLKEAIKSGWESFKNADAEEKGEMLGRLLFNFTPAASLMNVRLLSQVNRFTTGLTAIAKEAKHLKSTYKTSDLKSTFREAKIIARKANIEKDFKRALKIEGIPKELAPNLVCADLPDGVAGAFVPEQYTVYINKASLEKKFSFSFGKTVRHEVKHVGQALSLAKSGLPIPKKREIPFIPDSIVEMARSHPQLKVRSNVSPENMAQAFKEASRYQKKFRNARKYETFENIMDRLFAPKQAHIEELTNKMTKSAVSLGKDRVIGKLRAIKKAKVPVIRFLRVIKFTSPLIKEGLGQWGAKISSNVRRYLTNAIEKETWAVQRKYTGLAPRLHTPAVHNISRLSEVGKEKNVKTEEVLVMKQEDKGIVLDNAA